LQSNIIYYIINVWYGGTMTTKINNIKNIDNINYYIMIFIQLLIPIFFIDRVVSNLYNFDLLKFEYHNVLWILSPILVFIYLYKLNKK